MVKDIMKYLSEQDKEVGHAVELEFGRQSSNLELIASENIVSKAVMLAMGSNRKRRYDHSIF